MILDLIALFFPAMKILLTCLDKTPADQAHTTLQLIGLKRNVGNELVSKVHEHTYNYGEIPPAIIQTDADSWNMCLKVNAEQYFLSITHVEFNPNGSIVDLLNFHAEKIFVFAKRTLPAPVSTIDRIVDMPSLLVPSVQADVSNTWIGGGVRNRKLDVTMGFDGQNKLIATVNWEVF